MTEKRADNSPLSHFLQFVQILLDRIEHAANRIIPALIVLAVLDVVQLIVRFAGICN